jgi:hypothetical protein
LVHPPLASSPTGLLAVTVTRGVLLECFEPPTWGPPVLLPLCSARQGQKVPGCLLTFQGDAFERTRNSGSPCQSPAALGSWGVSGDDLLLLVWRQGNAGWRMWGHAQQRCGCSVSEQFVPRLRSPCYDVPLKRDR